MIDLNALSLPALFDHLTQDDSLHRLLRAARHEDLGKIGDLTTQSIVERHCYASTALVPREAGVVAGLPTMVSVLEVFGASLTLDISANDGDRCEADRPIARLAGSLADLLPLERTLLNILGHLSHLFNHFLGKIFTFFQGIQHHFQNRLRWRYNNTAQLFSRLPDG